MISRLSVAFAAALLAASICAQAQDPSPKGRIDVNGVPGKVAIAAKSVPEGCVTYDGTAWMKDSGECNRVFSFPSSKDSWTSSSFSFTPSIDGEVTLTLRGDYFPKEKGSSEILPVWVYIANVKVDGASLQNASFEAQTDGKPDSWNMGSSAVFVTDKALLPEGAKGAVKVWHNAPVSQKIAVKGGQDVTVSFQHKGAE